MLFPPKEKDFRMFWETAYIFVLQVLLVFINNMDCVYIGRENCVSVWSFCYDAMTENNLKDDDSFNNQNGSGSLD